MIVVKKYTDINHQTIITNGAKNVNKRIIIGSSDGAPLFSMRLFEVAPKGNTPHHQHNYEHEIFVLEGSGKVISSSQEYIIKSGSAILITAGEEHEIINTGIETLKLICLVPKEYE